MNPPETSASIQDLNQASEVAITIFQENKPADVVIQIQKTQSCPVCLDEYPHDQMIILRICQHSFCSGCLKGYLETRVKTLQVLNIPCPQSGCKEAVEDSTIKRILDSKQYIKYRDTVLNKMVNRDLEHKFCPKPGCARSLRLSRKTEYATCSCGTQVCNVCCNYWHEGKTCLEAIDTGFEMFSKENDIRFCMLCKTTVKKEEGCRHITCPVCDYEWCWVCGREYASHKCPGHWSPMPPSSLTSKFKFSFKEYSLKEKIFLIILGILFSPIILPMLFLIWPLFFCFKQQNLSWKKPIKSFCIILSSLLIGVFTLPVTIFYGGLFVVAVIIIAPIVLIVELLSFLCSCLKTRPPPGSVPAPAPAQSVPKKRWMTGDENQFSYTNKAQAPIIPAVIPVAPVQASTSSAVKPNTASIALADSKEKAVINLKNLTSLRSQLPTDNTSVKIYEALRASKIDMKLEDLKSTESKTSKKDIAKPSALRTIKEKKGEDQGSDFADDESEDASESDSGSEDEEWETISNQQMTEVKFEENQINNVISKEIDSDNIKAKQDIVRNVLETIQEDSAVSEDNMMGIAVLWTESE